MKNTKNPLQPLIDKAIAEGIEKGPAARDILTDYLHLCQDNGLRFQDLLVGATEVFKEERGLIV